MVNRIFTLNFEPAQNVHLIITNLIWLECHCVKTKCSSTRCHSCILLRSTAVNTKLVLDEHL